MSQKSSLLQPARFVSWGLTLDNKDVVVVHERDLVVDIQAARSIGIGFLTRGVEIVSDADQVPVEGLASGVGEPKACVAD